LSTNSTAIDVASYLPCNRCTCTPTWWLAKSWR